jgi:hypothetical protein
MPSESLHERALPTPGRAAGGERARTRPSAPPICCDVLKSLTRALVGVHEPGRRDESQQNTAPRPSEEEDRGQDVVV